MSNLKKLALEHGNIAKVHSNVNKDYSSTVTHTTKPDWKLLKHNRFAKNLLKRSRDANIDDIINAVGNSSPIYNNTLRNEHLVLLMAAQSVLTFSTLARYSNGSIYILVNHQLLEEIPHIPGIKSKRLFLSYKGFQLLDHWNKKYKRFQPYYNAFVNEDIRGKAKEYSVIRLMGGVHKDVKEIAEINTELNRKITKREKTFKLQQAIQNSMRKKTTLPYLTPGPSTYTGTTIVDPLIPTTGTPLITTSTIQHPTDFQITTGNQHVTVLGGLFGSLFGGK